MGTSCLLFCNREIHVTLCVYCLSDTHYLTSTACSISFFVSEYFIFYLGSFFSVQTSTMSYLHPLVSWSIIIFGKLPHSTHLLVLRFPFSYISLRYSAAVRHRHRSVSHLFSRFPPLAVSRIVRFVLKSHSSLLVLLISITRCHSIGMHKRWLRVQPFQVFEMELHFWLDGTTQTAQLGQALIKSFHNQTSVEMVAIVIIRVKSFAYCRKCEKVKGGDSTRGFCLFRPKGKSDFRIFPGRPQCNGRNRQNPKWIFEWGKSRRFCRMLQGTVERLLSFTYLLHAFDSYQTTPIWLEFCEFRVPPGTRVLHLTASGSDLFYQRRVLPCFPSKLSISSAVCWYPSRRFFRSSEYVIFVLHSTDFIYLLAYSFFCLLRITRAGNPDLISFEFIFGCPSVETLSWK